MRWLAMGLVLASGQSALAEELADRVRFSGWAASDVRFDVDDYRGAVPGGFTFSLNRNDVDLRLELVPAERAVAVVDARLRYFGLGQASTLGTLSDRNRVDPFSLQLTEAFVAVKGFPHRTVDLKAGRMVQAWGAADMFNPTDNLSSHDFSDPLDYTSKVPNQMVQVDWYPAPWLALTGVWVPVFKPSQLPPSAVLGFAVERDSRGCLLRAPAPPVSQEDGKKLASLFGALDPCSLNFLDPQVQLVFPENRFKDSQAALRAKAEFEHLSLTASYYYGRFSFPVAYTALADVDPSATRPGAFDVLYRAEVMFPRMQVAGLDFTYSSPALLDIGFRGELALIFPEEVEFGLVARQAGARLVEMSAVNVPSKPFVKATLGADYTFTSWIYVNAMYVHGFFDEFNDRYGLHDYAVLATDLKFRGDSVLVRLTGMLNFQDRSNITFPQVTWIAVPGVELALGAFIYGGTTNPRDPTDYAARSKFGQKAAGRSVAFTKAKVTF